MRRLSISLHVEFGRDPDADREVQTIPASIDRAEMDSRPIGFRAKEER